MTGADLGAAVEHALQCKGWPFYGAELTLRLDVPDTFPTVEVWDDAWGMLVCIVCCDCAEQAHDAYAYGRQVSDEREFDVSVQVMWPTGWEEDEG